jgi:hypothetical protein
VMEEMLLLLLPCYSLSLSRVDANEFGVENQIYSSNVENSVFFILIFNFLFSKVFDAMERKERSGFFFFF